MQLICSFKAIQHTFCKQHVLVLSGVFTRSCIVTRTKHLGNVKNYPKITFLLANTSAENCLQGSISYLSETGSFDSRLNPSWDGVTLAVSLATAVRELSCCTCVDIMT